MKNFKNDRVFVCAGERHYFLPNGVPESREPFLSQDLVRSSKFLLNSHFTLVLFTSQ
jgi:hypothetical protein